MDNHANFGSCVNKKAQLSLTNTADASASVARFI